MSGLDASLVARVEIVDGDAEVGMIEDVEEFGAELEVFVFGEAEILERGEVPLLVAGPLDDVAAGVAELPDLRGQNELLKGGRVIPAIGRAGVRAVGASALGGIADEIGTIAREAGDFRSAALC